MNCLFNYQFKLANYYQLIWGASLIHVASTSSEETLQHRAWEELYKYALFCVLVLFRPASSHFTKTSIGRDLRQNQIFLIHVAVLECLKACPISFCVTCPLTSIPFRTSAGNQQRRSRSVFANKPGSVKKPSKLCFCCILLIIN